MMTIFRMNGKGIKRYGVEGSLDISIHSKEDLVSISYTKNVINNNGMMNNELCIPMETFKDIFDIQLVAYCSVANTKDDFDADVCEHGDCIFYLPCGWVIDKINEDASYSAYKKHNINTVEDLLSWNDEYTHEEGYNLFMAAQKEKLKFEYTVVNCDYCSGNGM